MIEYSQSSHMFILPNGAKLTDCYSGGGPENLEFYRNNPVEQEIRFLGPLPQGQYTISPAHTVPHLGPIVMALTPAPTNQMYGRSGFFIHGDNAEQNFTASDGCIVCGPQIRQQIADLVLSGEDQLTVIA
jgi:hypothetical protein